MCLGHRKSKKKRDSKNAQPQRESVRSLNNEWRKTSKYSQLTSSLLSSNFWDFTHAIGMYPPTVVGGGGGLWFFGKFLRDCTFFFGGTSLYSGTNMPWL